MRKADVRVGGRYVAKVSGRLVVVSIQSTLMTGGWMAVNTLTGRKLRIRGGQRLRRPVENGEEEPGVQSI